MKKIILYLFSLFLLIETGIALGQSIDKSNIPNIPTYLNIDTLFLDSLESNNNCIKISKDKLSDIEIKYLDIKTNSSISVIGKYNTDSPVIYYMYCVLNKNRLFTNLKINLLGVDFEKNEVFGSAMIGQKFYYKDSIPTYITSTIIDSSILVSNGVERYVSNNGKLMVVPKSKISYSIDDKKNINEVPILVFSKVLTKDSFDIEKGLEFSYKNSMLFLWFQTKSNKSDYKLLYQTKVPLKDSSNVLMEVLYKPENNDYYLILSHKEKKIVQILLTSIIDKNNWVVKLKYYYTELRLEIYDNANSKESYDMVF